MWLALDAAIAMPVSLALSVLVARSVGPDVLGVYNFANWVLGAGIVVVTNGVTYGMQLYAAEKLGKGDLAGAMAVLAHGLRWQLALAAVLVSLGTVLTLALSPPPFRAALLLAVLSVAPAILVSVPAAGLGAAQAFSANVVSSIAAVLVNLAVAVVALSAGWGLVGVTSALLLSRLVDAGGRYLAWRRVLAALKAEPHGQMEPRDDSLEAPKLRKLALNASVLLLVEMLVWDRSEFLVLSRFSPLRELAFYSLSFNIAQQILIPSRLLSKALGANLLVERGRNPEGVARLSRDGMRYVFLLAAPSTLGLASLDRALMPLLYGSNYASAVPVLTVVATFAVVRGALLPVQAFLYMTEQQVLLVRFSIVQGCVNLALALWLIPSHGAIGAAWANGVTQALATSGLIIFASRRLGLSAPLTDMVRILLACAPMVIIVRWLASTMPPWPAVIVGVPAGAIVYLVGLKLIRVITPVDRVRLQSADATLPAAMRPLFRRLLSWLVPPGAGN